MDEIPERLRSGAGIWHPSRPDAHDLHRLARHQRAIAVGDAAVRLGAAARRILTALAAGAMPALREVLPSSRALP